MATAAYILPNTMNKILLGATICDPKVTEVTHEEWNEYSNGKRKDEEALMSAISSYHTITGVFPTVGIELLGTYKGREPRFYRLRTVTYIPPDESSAKIEFYFDPVPTTDELFELAKRQSDVKV